MLLYQLVITALVALPFAIALWNCIAFAAIRRGERPSRPIRVSVLVPARNEERSIGDCISSLLAQRYDDFQVIALNDGSEDRTGEILRALAAREGRLRVIDGAPLPEGWVGKNWACSQLAREADGALLLFTDADTVHAPESVAACAAFAERSGAGLFCGVPRQEMKTFWERVIVPLAPFLYMAYLPNRWITTRRDPRFVAANGQLLCARREAYELIGGHAAVRDDLVEDMALARLAKRRGIRVSLATAVETASCRMYRSLGEIVEGFSKNLFPGLGYSLPVLIFFLFSFLLLYLAPFLQVLASLLTGAYTPERFWLPMLQLALAAAIRGMMALRFRMDLRQILYHPISAAAAIAIAINSYRWARRRDGITWKGRSYGGPGIHRGA